MASLPNWLAGILILFFCNSLSFAQELKRYEFKAPKMGTEFRMVFYTQDSSFAQEIAQKAFLMVDSMNGIFSNYSQDSEISQLTKKQITKEKIQVSAPLTEVLEFSQKISRQSKGAFDVTIGPLAKLWRRAFRRKQFPDAARLEAAKALVNYKYIKLYPKKKQVGFQKAGLQLDFGGIAKGFTLDQVSLVLKNHNIENYLIDIGGDLLMGMPPPDQPGWPIALPDGSTQYFSNRAMATSGDWYQYLEWNGQRYSHIIDPRTGVGIKNQKTVTILAKRGMAADAFASTLSILSEKKGRRLALKHRFEVFYYQNKK